MRYRGEGIGELVLHLEQLDNGKTARAWRRRRKNLVFTPCRPQWLAPDGTISFEVVGRDQAIAAFHLRHDQAGRLAAVEIIGPQFRDAPQCLAEFGLPERSLSGDTAETGVEVGRVAEPILLRMDVVDQRFRGQKPFLRQSDGRHNEIFPVQLAVALVGFPQSGNGAGHAGSLCADQAGVFDHLAMFVEIHITVRRERRGFPVIEERGHAVHVDHHEAAAADIAGVDECHRHGEADGDGRIDSVAASPQYLLGDLGAIVVGDRNRGGPLYSLRRTGRCLLAGFIRRAAAGEPERRRQEGGCHPSSISNHGCSVLPDKKAVISRRSTSPCRGRLRSAGAVRPTRGHDSPHGGPYP